MMDYVVSFITQHKILCIGLSILVMQLLYDLAKGRIS